MIQAMATKDRRPASITDVAKKAGVSISTISRALNDKDRLNPETYERVQRAIHDLNYRKARRGPSHQRPHTVAIVVPTIEDPFFSVILHGLDAVAKAYDYNIVFFDSANSAETEMQNVNRILESSLDGVVFVPTGDTSVGYQRLREAGLPVMLLDRLLDVDDPSYVISNDEEGAYLAVKYLIDLGHRSILYVGGFHNTSTERARLRGYERALQERGLPVNNKSVSECCFDSESAYDSMQRILSDGLTAFTAVFGGNDLIAFGAIKALREHSLGVPEDVSVVGYGDMPFAGMISLTSVSCPALEMGRSVMTMLVHTIEKKFISSRNVVMRPTLVLRSSCKKVVE